jgi:DNA-binding HxlR family transcriptional regulator
MASTNQKHEGCYMNDQCAKHDICPMILMQNTLSGKWKLLILWYLGDKTLRFSELQRKLPLVTQKILSQQLKSLEKDKLINRKVYPVVPPKVEYSLTDDGNKFLSILAMMHKFGSEYLEARINDGTLSSCNQPEDI